MFTQCVLKRAFVPFLTNILRIHTYNVVEIFNLRIQVMVVVIVVLVGIPYIILHNSLTADEQEDKYEEAHR